MDVRLLQLQPSSTQEAINQVPPQPKAKKALPYPKSARAPQVARPMRSSITARSCQPGVPHGEVALSKLNELEAALDSDQLTIPRILEGLNNLIGQGLTGEIEQIKTDLLARDMPEDLSKLEDRLRLHLSDFEALVMNQAVDTAAKQNPALVRERLLLRQDLKEDIDLVRQYNQMRSNIAEHTESIAVLDRLNQLIDGLNNKTNTVLEYTDPEFAKYILRRSPRAVPTGSPYDRIDPIIKAISFYESLESKVGRDKLPLLADLFVKTTDPQFKTAPGPLRIIVAHQDYLYSLTKPGATEESVLRTAEEYFKGREFGSISRPEDRASEPVNAARQRLRRFVSSHR